MATHGAGSLDELCREISLEHDPDKLMHLLREINGARAERRRKAEDAQADIGRSEQDLPIAQLPIAREEDDARSGKRHAPFRNRNQQNTESTVFLPLT